MGQIDALTIFLDVSIRAHSTMLREGMSNGIDQGVFNYLVINGNFTDSGCTVTSWPFQRGPTIQLAVAKRVCSDPSQHTCLRELGVLDAKGRIVNLDGSVTPVAHQWDRFAPELKTIVRDVWAMTPADAREWYRDQFGADPPTIIETNSTQKGRK